MLRFCHISFLALCLVTGALGETVQAQVLFHPIDFANDLNGMPDDEGWSVFEGMVVPDHGPLGVGDHALLYSTPNRFHFNTSTNSAMLGNYSAFGVTTLEFDVRHSGDGENVDLRVFLFSGAFRLGFPHAISSEPLTISTEDTTWQTHNFPLLPSDLIPIQGDLSALLANVTQIGLRHDPHGSGARSMANLDLGAEVYFDNVRLIGPPPRPGDFQQDGDVDLEDLYEWQGAFGSSADADADEDGDSDGQDFLLWQLNVTSFTNGALVSVPEPMGMTGYCLVLTISVTSSRVAFRDNSLVSELL